MIVWDKIKWFAEFHDFWVRWNLEDVVILDRKYLRLNKWFAEFHHFWVRWNLEDVVIVDRKYLRLNKWFAEFHHFWVRWNLEDAQRCGADCSLATTRGLPQCTICDSLQEDGLTCSETRTGSSNARHIWQPSSGKIMKTGSAANGMREIKCFPIDRTSILQCLSHFVYTIF